MIYPVAKTKKEFNEQWYDAQGFGVKTSYGYHDANDINIRTGGNTDLGKDLYAVEDGTIVYYHNSKHPTTGFGRHMVLEVETKEGTRWFHYAHCDVITSKTTKVKKGEVIGKLGKSGTQYAHLHFSCFKVDPGTFANGIDAIAKTLTDLNKNWIDALKFIENNLDGECEDLKEIEVKYAELTIKYDKLRRVWDERDIEFDALKMKLEKALEDLGIEKTSNEQLGLTIKGLQDKLKECKEDNEPEVPTEPGSPIVPEVPKEDNNFISWLINFLKGKK